MSILTSCLEDRCELTRTFVVYEPVYVTEQEFRHDLQATSPQQLCEPGKIYYYRDFLFVSEEGEGIHIIDNQNPAQPVNLAFLPVPGAMDMAIRGNYLYANSYVDLVVFDLAAPLQPRLVSRVKEAFPYYGTFSADLGYTVEFRETPQTVTVRCGDPNYDRNYFYYEKGGLVFTAIDVAFDASNGGSGGAEAGIGGSLARFTIAQDHLYIVDNNNLKVYGLAQPTEPVAVSDIIIGWGIETIFPYGDKLFIGSQSGMFIFDNSEPAQPRLLSRFDHARACDPVFVAGDLAYVTLRDGTTCDGFINQLDVIDVSDLTNPVLLKTYPMHHPVGLSVVDDQLLLCEDDQGLKIFDVSDWRTIDSNLLSHWRGMTAMDVIAFRRGDNALAIVVGPDGIHQLDFTDPKMPKALSHLTVCP